MKRTTEAPKITESNSAVGHDTVMTHPAFAQIQASRVSGEFVLYGSDFVHHNSIRIRIASSKLSRGLSTDWPTAQEELIEVELSEAQWATFVSSLNVGSGVQCTLRHMNCVPVPEIPAPIMRHEQFKAEADATVQKAHDALAALEAKLNDVGLSDKRKKELSSHIESARRAIGSSLDFVAKQFDEHMERSTEKAKMEVNAYVTTTIHRAGLEKLGVKPIQIEQNKE